MKYRLQAAGFVLAALVSCSPNPEQETNSISIASWNVQALFDGNDEGKEYGEYSAEQGWTEEKYRSRFNALADAVKNMCADSGEGSSQPDILALIEIENEAVIGELAVSLNYGWTFFAAAPGAALGIGLLSRFPVVDARTHSANFGGKAAPRPIAELWIDAGGETLALMVCHWKSKLGGGKETEAIRRSEAALVARRLGEIGAAHPGIPVAVIGDLNENHDEFFRTGYPCALMPAGSAAEIRVGKSARPGFQDFLVLGASLPPGAENSGLPDMVLYSPWLSRENEGSYYYKDRWETIDHILLNGAAFDRDGWNFASFHAVREPPFTGASGTPAAYVPRTGNGLSDHLPLVTYLEKL
jgi:predicted extracellular nuclease